MEEQVRKYRPFRETLPFAEEAQERVANLLRAAGALANKKDSKDRHDFEAVWHRTHRVEVKNEDNQTHTGNICLETRQGWPLRVSGVAYSDATIFVHTLKDNCVLYRRREMIQWLRGEVAAGRRFEQGPFGDNNNHGFIVRIEDLLNQPWFDYRPMSTLPESELWRS